ncbi:MAG: GldG family protein [Candidatus Omnitrophica bacterium]|nr:GldG family protein [Candidatus Omnitrophota bacterium]
MSRFRRLIIRFEILVVSVVLLATFGMLLALLSGHNRRWDLTQEKIYSFSKKTVDILKAMKGSPLEILAFYPARDDNKTEIEVFFKEAAIIHGGLSYHFYDPQKQPALTRELGVKDIYTTLFRYKGREERTVLPDEEAFATALVRLMQPRQITVCAVTGHGESETGDTAEKGLSHLSTALKDRNLNVRDILLAAEGIPSLCHVVLIPGPQKNWTRDELELVRKFYSRGGGVLFLIDPTDQSAGPIFTDFFKSLGVKISSNVIVDKMSRAVGGDFLVPFVNQYNPDHPLTRNFHDPTFFPVTRTVEPAGEIAGHVAPIAFSGSNSWAETNLQNLEQGEAVFEVESDTPGPLSVAVAMMPAAGDVQTKGRMVVMGDSDFMTNAYLDLSANRDFALHVLDWLANDDRIVVIDSQAKNFVPFTLTSTQQLGLFTASVIGMPLLFFTAGAAGIFWRRTRS